MSSQDNTITDSQKEKRQMEYFIYFLIVIFGLTLILAIKQRGEIIELKKERCELKGYKQAWVDFNKSYIPKTALPRIPEVEAIFGEGK